PADDEGASVQTLHRLAHGSGIDAPGPGNLLYGSGRLLTNAREQPRLRWIEVDTGTAHPLLVGTPTLVATRDHAQHSLELPFRVGVSRRGESLADAFCFVRPAQWKIGQQPAEHKREHADHSGDEVDRLEGSRQRLDVWDAHGRRQSSDRGGGRRLWGLDTRGQLQRE